MVNPGFSLKGNVFTKKGWKRDELFLKYAKSRFKKSGFENAYMLPPLVESHSHIGVCSLENENKQKQLNVPFSKANPNTVVSKKIDLKDSALNQAKSAGLSFIAVDSGSRTPYSGLGAILRLNKQSKFSIEDSKACYKISLGSVPKKACHLSDSKIKEAIFLLAKSNKLDKTVPLKVHAYSEDSLEFAASLTKLGFEVIALHASGLSKASKSVLKSFKTIILGPLLHVSLSCEAKDNTVENALKIFRRRQDCCISTDHPVTPIQFLRLNAILLNSQGLSEKAAIDSITTNPSKALGVKTSQPILENAQNADFCVFDGHPLELKSKPVAVFSQGKPLILQKKGRRLP